jgi:hypothetical protein
LLIPETSDGKGEGGGGGNSYTVKGGGSKGGESKGGTDFGTGGKGEGEGEGEEPHISPEGDGGGGDDDGGNEEDEDPEADGGDGDGEEQPEGEDKDGKGDGDDRKIKVGDKVRVKSSGKTGVVTQVNDDGTYEVTEIQDDVAEYADGGVFKVSAIGDAITEIIGTYPEDELEVISTSKGDGKGDSEGDGRGDGEGRDGEGGDGEGEGGDEEGEPNMPDLEELKIRLRTIRAKKIKFPMLAKTFFNAKIGEYSIETEIFYNEKARLALLNRGAKEVLKYKNPMPAEQAKEYFRAVGNLQYFNHIEFLKSNVQLYGIVGGMAYLINPERPIVLKDNNGNEIEYPSLMEIQERLDDGVLTDFERNNFFEFLLQTIQLFEALEKFQVLDDFYYRIISLTAVLKPELFGSDYISAHFDFICQYLRIRSFGLTNDIFMAFSQTDLTNERIFERVESRIIRGNLILFNILAKEEGYIVYRCENIRNKSNNNDRLNIDKLNVRDISLTDRIDIVFNIVQFYDISPTLRNNENVKNTVMMNLEKISILQKQSYASYLTDINLLLSSY